MRGRTAPPHPGIYRVPPPPWVTLGRLGSRFSRVRLLKRHVLVACGVLPAQFISQQSLSTQIEQW